VTIRHTLLITTRLSRYSRLSISLQYRLQPVHLNVLKNVVTGNTPDFRQEHGAIFFYWN